MKTAETKPLAEAYNELRAEYNAARDSRFRRRLFGVNPTGSGADYHYKSEQHYLKMIERSRAYDRDDVVVGQGVNRLVNNVIQDGFKLDPDTGNDELDQRLAARWKEWCVDERQCHRGKYFNYNAIRRLALRHTVVDGDFAALALKDGSLELIEGHRIRTPRDARDQKVVNGVKLNDHRERVEYWITRDDIDPTRSLVAMDDVVRRPARDGQGRLQVFHVFNPKRVSQTRGVTAFAPIVDAVGMHDDIQFAKLVQQQIVSCFAILRSRELGLGDDPGIPEGSQETETHPDGSTTLLEGIGPGMDVKGLPGEKITGFSPNVPNPEFFPHATMILTFIAINLDIPLQLLLLDPTKTNFSGWRGAMDQAKIGWTAIQDWMIDRLDRPVYRWKVAQWLADDPELRRLADQAGVDVFSHRWTRPRWPYIEPSKDIKAARDRADGNLASYRRILGEQGLDYDVEHQHMIEDRAKFIEAAIRQAEKLNALDPEARVDWREVAGFNPKGRRPETQQRVMEDITRAVRSGVPVSVSEARRVLNLPPDLPAGADILRFNDQDILQYHIEGQIVSINEARARLRLPPVDGGDVFISKQGVTTVKLGEEAAESEEAEEADRDDTDIEDDADE